MSRNAVRAVGQVPAARAARGRDGAAAGTVERGQRRRRRSLTRQRRRAGLVFVLPALAVVLVFFFVPLGLMAWMSVNDWPLLGGHRFTGTENYRQLFEDVQFRDALLFTAKYAAVVTPLLLIAGLGLALLVRSERRGVGIFRGVYFLPLVIGFAPAAYIWVWMLNPQVGVTDRILRDIGLVSHDIDWLSGARLAFVAATALVVWKTVGFSMLLLMGGLQSVPRDLHEAASVDGASRLRRFVSIEVPLIRRTIALVVVFSTVGSFLVFEPFFILTKGGPGTETMSVVHFVFSKSFFDFNLGYGAAASVVLMVVLVMLTSIQLFALGDDHEH